MNKVKIEPHNAYFYLLEAVKQGIEIPKPDISRSNEVPPESIALEKSVIRYKGCRPSSMYIGDLVNEDNLEIIDLILSEGSDFNDDVILFSDLGNENLFLAYRDYRGIIPEVIKLKGFRSLWEMTDNPYVIYLAALWFEKYKGLDLNPLDQFFEEELGLKN